MGFKLADNKYSFVQEIASSYEAKEKSNGDLEIKIVIPKRFKLLAMAKLSELLITEVEINNYERDESD